MSVYHDVYLSRSSAVHQIL